MAGLRLYLEDRINKICWESRHDRGWRRVRSDWLSGSWHKQLERPWYNYWGRDGGHNLSFFSDSLNLRWRWKFLDLRIDIRLGTTVETLANRCQPKATEMNDVPSGKCGVRKETLKSNLKEHWLSKETRTSSQKGSRKTMEFTKREQCHYSLYEQEGLGVRESGMDKYTQLYLKWTTNKDLPYSTGPLLKLCNNLNGKRIWKRIGTWINIRK